MQNFSHAVHAIYDSALSPENWPTALAEIADLFGARGAAIFFASRDGQTDFIASPSIRDAVRTYQEGNWVAQDIHAQRMIDLHLTSGDVVNDQLMVSDHEIETLPIYTDFFARVGFGWIMCCVILPDLDMLVTVSVPRAKERGPYTAAEMETLRLIGPHVEQALRISLRISNIEEAETVLRAALDRMDSGVFVLDDAGQSIYRNTIGDEVFPELFTTKEGRVVPVRREDDARFEALIAAVRAGEMAGADVRPKSCILTRRDGGRTAIWAMPVTLMNEWRIGTRTAAKTLLFAAPTKPGSKIDPAVVRDVFGLTLGEARLAALIGGGMTVRAAAGQLGVTEGTARVVLKRVFGKVGVKRQAELVLQLSSLGAVVSERETLPS
ncbi:hypothetical protein [Pseudoruegeria sp. SK021]|uniref:helix-turn-helix transcriptional regulator n=1 Tax=Pseudoruegeria sp. SK021 TaxID=1933035 RepID=UPI000A228A53|nr:hypothetical protein [Pseudoruegeria sp. SK021]OSP53810.1 hypothetical protein BV911_16005 [Pseudoruegeria sp. SK021]